VTALTLNGLDAVILDLDGVLTHTAAIHARAWKQTFDQFLEARLPRGVEAFDERRDYRQYVDGKPRYEGVRSFLQSRGITLPEGNLVDEPGKETIHGLGNLKNEINLELLNHEGAEVFPDAVDFVKHCLKSGMKTAVVSSSRNCLAVLDSVGLSDLFDVRVDGIDLERMHLHGKPEPDLFLEAARRLAVEPAKSAVFEDAIAGVEAGRTGGFGLVIGVNRTGEEASLKEHGAHLTVKRLDELLGPSGTVSKVISKPVDRLVLKHELWQSLEGRRLVLFLDYDGTLTPIVRNPEEAKLSEPMRDAIRELASLCRVAIVSGRDRKDVESFIQLDGLVYAGSHGFDIAGPHGLKMEHKEAKARLDSLDAAEKELREKLTNVPGAWIERKHYAIAVHYRKTPKEYEDTVRKEVSDVASKHADLRQRGGKKVFELQPDLDWDKGKAVVWLLEALELESPDVMPIYVGDDLTDEDAFRALAGRGLRFIVGPLEHRTEADYCLKDVHEVERLLHELKRLLRKVNE
jgi:trehalose-phosphatase